MSNTHNSLTPIILEDSKFSAIGVDVYSRLLKDRIIYFGDSFNQETCNLVIAQLLYLSNQDPSQDITIYINSLGGSVIDGLAIIDTINFIPNDVSTICVGHAASMGAVLLSSGTKGKRYVLPHSRIMIHQVSSTIEGTYADMKIAIEQTERCAKDINNILAMNMNKSPQEIEQLCDRDNWFIGEEAISIGIADHVVNNKCK